MDSELKQPSTKTNLHRPFVFWFSFYKQSLNRKKKEGFKYEENINKICSFSTIEDFWAFYQHMIRPEQLPIGCDFFLFQESIKPMWEDEANKAGGRFILKVKKQYGNKFWEDLILAFIGEQYDGNEMICGLNASVKEKEVILSVWLKKMEENDERREEIKKSLRKILGLSEKVEIEYREHPTEKQIHVGGITSSNMNVKKME